MTRKILVRFDDICPTMDFANFNEAVNLMDKYDVKPLIGVIPECKDKVLEIESVHLDFWEYVKSLQAKGYVVAMHGVNHVFCSQHRGIVTKRIGSEFAGLPLDVQVEMIRKGKEILNAHGIYTESFFAPAHSYDENTLKALNLNGFKYMSDGKSAKPYMLNGIKCIPCRSHGCPKIPKSGYITALFHAHEWALPNKEIDAQRFKNLINNYHKDIVTYAEYIAQDCGNSMIQQLDEKLYLIWSIDIKPFLAKVKHFLLHRR